MSASMAEVLAGHQVSSQWVDYPDPDDSDNFRVARRLMCLTCGQVDEPPAAHQAEQLAAHGYGKLTAVQLAARDRPESMEAARAQVRAQRREAQAETIRRAKAQALEEAATDFEDNMGVAEFDEQAERDGMRWTRIEEAWEHQGPYMDWLRNRAATERGQG